jgi:type II secretory pathway pseudopilin PulG
MKPILILLIAAALIVTSNADDRRKHREHRESHNYIIERQQAYQVQGVPTSRLIIGKREIDVYPNGLMFEKNNVVGISR